MKQETQRKMFDGKMPAAFLVLTTIFAILIATLTVASSVDNEIQQISGAFTGLFILQIEDLPDAKAPEEIQIYENAKFANKDLTYEYVQDCEERKYEMDKAFAILERETVLTFTESENADIIVHCSSETMDKIVAEGGPSRIIRLDGKTKILEGQIKLYGEKSDCEEPIIEVHELLHVLGFNHQEEKDSALYPYYHCDQEIPTEVIDKIAELYL